MSKRAKPFKLQYLALGWRQCGLWLTVHRTRTEAGAIAASDTQRLNARGDYRLRFNGETRMTWWAK